MSGHSKWSTIKRQKGVADIKRGQVFTKITNVISIAVKQSGGNTDPESNFKLRLAIEKARSVNMPKDNIERAIQKAKGAEGGGDLQEVVYEGFAHGAAIMVEAVTDNKQRTVSEVKNIIEKGGGNLGSQGSVSYLFERLGEIAIKIGNKTEDELFEIGIETNSKDFITDEQSVIFYVEPSALMSSKKALEEKGMAVESAQLVYKPMVNIEISTEAGEKLTTLFEKLEDLGDVQNVFSNI